MKTLNLAGAVIFGLVGLTALIAALFFSATHQFAIAAICAIMATTSGAEYVAEKKKEEIC